MSLPSQLLNYIWPNSHSTTSQTISFQDGSEANNVFLPHAATDTKKSMERREEAQALEDEGRAPYVHV